MDNLKQAIEGFASDTGFDDAEDMLEFLNMHGLKLVLKKDQQDPEGDEDESLTEVQRNVLLANGGGLTDKAVRIIDKRDAKIAKLTEELTLEKELVTLHAEGASRAEREVRELTEKLAAAEDRIRELKTHNAQCGDRYDAAEARVRELEAEVREANEASLYSAQREQRANGIVCLMGDGLRRAETQLAAANALLGDAVEHLDQAPLLVSEIEAHLSAQPAAPRAGFDCQPGSPGYCDGCSVCQPAAPTGNNTPRPELDGRTPREMCVSGYVGKNGECNDCGKHHEAPTDHDRAVLLCGACTAGRPDDCSGWCGVEVPAWVGPVQPHVWEEMRDLGCFVDPWLTDHDRVVKGGKDAG